ncbi:MAG TPA: cell division protein ZapA [Candidatus Sumerlaeota bacterium]|nr:MAG: Cell division protein ZapA [candidate division BRC1 bacterium ADurb.BinA292]HOE97355.1 cell division protein ZapA [Candidatus Sumerlaeota bacterium]HOR26721.1 cell division protein ZapA [Candidatus Sumerlaeota bacterium]HPK01255.1 cell division protein ZapA [Candidatus Sumerlaeota bacterium]
MHPITITIADQSFRVLVEEGEEKRYERVQQLADEAYHEILRTGANAGLRAMAMALFQVAMDLDEARQLLRKAESSRDRLSDLIRRIDRATERSAHAAPPPAPDRAE